MWHLPGPRIEPVNPALASEFFTPVPPGIPPWHRYILTRLLAAKRHFYCKKKKKKQLSSEFSGTVVRDIQGTVPKTKGPVSCSDLSTDFQCQQGANESPAKSVWTFISGMAHQICYWTRFICPRWSKPKAETLRFATEKVYSQSRQTRSRIHKSCSPIGEELGISVGEKVGVVISMGKGDWR